jgi:hypothetical protein
VRTRLDAKRQVVDRIQMQLVVPVLIGVAVDAPTLIT